jgi:SAM-dependent methyltransferase
MYSKEFANFYDALMGDTHTVMDVAKKLIFTSVPSKSHILELGCGTGNVLKELTKQYALTGIDNAEQMLTIAKKKAPRASFYRQDIRDFKLPDQFDAILCVFDTINHLTKQSEWKSLFRASYHHLKKNGVFIFDMNTQKRLSALAATPAYVSKISPTTLACVKITELTYGQYSGRFQIFADLDKKTVQYIEQVVSEASFPQEEVEKMLHPYFTIEKRIDPIRKRITYKSGRIFYVCRKK